MEVPFHFPGFLVRSQENSKFFFTIAGYLPGLIMLIGRCLIQSSTSQVDSNGRVMVIKDWASHSRRLNSFRHGRWPSCFRKRATKETFGKWLHDICYIYLYLLYLYVTYLSTLCSIIMQNLYFKKKACKKVREHEAQIHSSPAARAATTLVKGTDF